ncbi:MAG TPA: SpvB/TcaC N-terminal domain-containing protein, partial [Bacteroidia bacterium]|nr:SpvB/TcaC N-terminal domain-containing protein [Bacteroidia bacterium]
MKIKISPTAILKRFIFSLLFLFLAALNSKAQIIATIAGNGTAGYSGDASAATLAEINLPSGVAVDATGNIYISDTQNNRIRKVSTSGIISTIAGNGVGGFNGDGGQATAAEINAPHGITLDASGNLYFADGSNNRIREINTSGVMSTFAGNGVAGFSGNGGLATAAELHGPTEITFDGSGNAYIADGGNDRIRKVNSVGLTIAAFAGNGVIGSSGDGGQATAAELSGPADVYVDGSGNAYIADKNNNRIRKVTSGTISTIAGNGVAGYSGDGGAATIAEINAITGVRVSSTGVIYIGDFGNNRIREISSGTINTLAGITTSGFSGDGGQASSAELDNPGMMAFDQQGNLYFIDHANNRVRVAYLSLNVTTSVTANVSCNGGNTGSASTTVIHGTTPYTYSWSGGGTNSTVTGLSAGTYTINVTDYDGITGSSTVTITQPTALSVSASATSNVSCNGGSNGSVSSTPSGGTSPYTYSWSGGGTNSTKASLIAGTYTITVTDNNGCIATTTATITQPTALTVSANVTSNVTCNGENNGSVSSTPSGGVSPYTYSWSAGGTNSTKASLTSGTYTITVTDNNGCTATSSATITQPTVLTVLASVTANVSCNGGNSGSLSSTPSGGTSPYTYSWSGGGTNSTKTGLSAGTYTITITDNNGCTGSTSATITEPTALNVSASVTANISCNGGSNGSVSSTPSGGTSPYTYSWSGGGTNSTKTGLAIGTYTITITDKNGCTATSSATVTQPTTLSVSASVTANVSYNGWSDGSVSASSSGGTSPYTYLWTGDGTNSSEEGLMAGTYTITLMDNNGCTATASCTITQPLGVLATVTYTVSGTGVTTGNVSTMVSGGTSPYSYSWSDGGTNSVDLGLSAGIYTITVTDINGLVATVSFTINQPITYVSQLQTNILSSEETVGPNTSLAVGKTPYSYGVSPSGGASYSVPIVVPPGTMGMAPKLSITYNSQSNGGSLGYGWSLAGLSCISRSGQTPYHNFGEAYPDQTQGVTLTNADWFTLDGNRLITTSGDNGISGTTYATESETYDLITSYGSRGVGPAWFQVQTKNGLTIEYGNTNDSRLIPVGKTTTYAWYVDKITDQFGNYITFHYMSNNGEIRVQEIDYTGNSTTGGFAPYNSVLFTYANKSDPNTTYVAGGALNSTVILKNITINSHSTFFKKYSFLYTSNLYTFLQEIDETGSDYTTLNPLKFSYASDAPIVGSSCTGTLAPFLHSNYCVQADPSALGGISDGISGYGQASQFTLLDYNGDGKEDVISLYGTNGEVSDWTGEGPPPPPTEFGFGWSSQVLHNGENSCPYFTSNSYSFPAGYPTSQGTLAYLNPMSNTPLGGLSQFAGDFNGDGRDDYAVSTFTTATKEDADQEEDINIALSTGTSFATANVLKAYDMYSNSSELLDASAPQGTTLSGTFYLDLNGDGQVDVFNYHFDPVHDTAYYRVWLNVSSSSLIPQEQPSMSFTTVPTGIPSPNFEVTTKEYFGMFLDFSQAIPMDLNGDGKTELVNVIERNGSPQKVIVSFDATQVYGQPNYCAEVDGGYTLSGLATPGNGIVIQPDNSGFQYNNNSYVASDSNYVLYNSSYTASGAYDSYFPITTYGLENVNGITTSIVNSGSPYVLYGDFNGDGITDVLTYDASTSVWTTNYGEGGGNYASLTASGLSTADNPFLYPAHYYYAHDVNGDGKTDILEFTPTYDSYTGAKSTVINTWYSTGTSFVLGDTITLANHNINPETWQISFGDFNGDGVDDLLLENDIGDGAVDGTPLLLYFHSGSHSRQLAEAVDGYNETVQFSYQSLANSSIYSRPNIADYRNSSSSNTLLDIQPPMYVVSRLTSVDGTGNHATTTINKDGNSNYVTYTDTNSTTYSYQDLIANRLGLGLLGFLNVSSYNTISGYNTSTTYSVTPSFDNMVPSTSTVTAVSTATTISDAAYTYTSVPLALGTLRYTVQQTQSVHNDDIAGITNTTNYTYDSYGNITDKNSQISVPSTSTTVETSDIQNTYVSNGTWIPSSVSTYTSTVTYLSNPSYTRIVSNSWDSYGHLLSTTSDPSTTGSVTTSNTYDTHTGAILSYTTTTTDPKCIATAETNSTTYDTWSQFKTSSTNPLGQVTYYTYNSMWGKPASVITPDALETDYYYDAFGRSSEIITPDGLTQTLTYNWVTSGELPIDGSDPFDVTPTSLYSVYSDKIGSPPLLTFYDWFDRQTIVESSTLSANVFKEQAYDAMGHDYQSTNNYQKATISSSYGDYDPVTITKLYNDVEYRLTSVTSTCASAATLSSAITYTSVAGNTTVTTTKPDGTTSSQTTDPSGAMVNSTDYLLSSPTTVYSSADYTYLSNGHASSVILNGETVQTFTYDDYGRQASLSDVNFSGNYSYVYNAYNQLYSQEDPNGNTSTMTYDLLGRPTTKVSSAEGTYTYNYVTSVDGLNQLLNQQLVNTAATYTSTISYTYDDLHRPLTMDVNGLTTTYYYDPTYGYLINKTYPGGFEITNIYDGSNYGFLVETDNTATSTAIWTANYMNPAGQYVDYTLGDGVNTVKSYSPYGLLQSISALGYQSSTYDFDPTNGNLSDRTENNLYETFTYDASLN